MLRAMKFFPLAIIKVIGSSMVPTFLPGQFILVSPLPYLYSEPKIGDVIVAMQAKRMVVKRIQYIDETSVFVVGDNPKESTDSRTSGKISRQDIIAKVLRK